MTPGARLNEATHISLGILFLALGLSFTDPKSGKTKTTSLILNIEHVVGERTLKLDSLYYTNKLGQSFTISKFKYYIGNIILQQDNGRKFQIDSYFLVNEEEESSKQIALQNIPEARYTSIEFIIGVDSLHNCSGAQSGALDPINGMFWAWNSGYIFLKLEGVSPASKSPGHIFEYHIGGYKEPANCIRKIKLDLSQKEPKTGTIFLKADILTLLENPNPINFEKLSSVTDFNNAPLFANNFKNMFSILNKEHED